MKKKVRRLQNVVLQESKRLETNRNALAIEKDSSSSFSADHRITVCIQSSDCSGPHNSSSHQFTHDLQCQFLLVNVIFFVQIFIPIDFNRYEKLTSSSKKNTRSWHKSLLKTCPPFTFQPTIPHLHGVWDATGCIASDMPYKMRIMWIGSVFFFRHWNMRMYHLCQHINPFFWRSFLVGFYHYFPSPPADSHTTTCSRIVDQSHIFQLLTCVPTQKSGKCLWNHGEIFKSNPCISQKVFNSVDPFPVSFIEVPKYWSIEPKFFLSQRTEIHLKNLVNL